MPQMNFCICMTHQYCLSTVPSCSITASHWRDLKRKLGIRPGYTANFVGLFPNSLLPGAIACFPVPQREACQRVGAGWLLTGVCQGTGAHGWAGIQPLLYSRNDLRTRQLKNQFVNPGIGKSPKFGHSSFNRYVFYCSVGKLHQATERFSPVKCSLLYIFFSFTLGIQVAFNNSIFIFLCFYFFVSSSGKCPYLANYLRKGLLQFFVRTKLLVYLYNCSEIWMHVCCTTSKATSYERN